MDEIDTGFLDRIASKRSGTQLQPAHSSNQPDVDTGFLNKLSDTQNVRRHYQKTGEKSLTGRPDPKVFTGEGGSGASFMTHLRAGYKYDPITKAEVYAAARFPDLPEDERLARYTYKNGEFLYQDDKGEWYSESPELFHQKAKALLGGTHWEPVIAGTLGELFFGPVMGGAFAAGGEAVHQQIAEAGGAKPGWARKAIDIGVEGGLGIAGDIPGRIGVRTARKVGAIPAGRKGMKFIKALGPEAPTINLAETVRIKQLYKDKFGVDLFDAQTSESRRLLNKINTFQDMPETADLIQSAKRIQDQQAYAATDKFWDDLAPAAPTREVGDDVVKAVNKSIDKEKMAMIGRASPYYDRAMKAKTQIDIRPHIQSLDKLIAESLENAPRRKKLQEFRQMLHRTVEKDVAVEVPIKTDQFGRTHTKTVINKAKEKIPESRIKQLDELKKTVDTFLKPKVGDSPIDNQTKRNIRDIKNGILTDLDDANEQYRLAREIWSGDAQSMERLTNKTRLKYIADLEGDKVVDATKNIFATAGNSPEILAGIRVRIINENPKLWEKVLRTHLETQFKKIPQKVEGGAEGASKVFGAFWRNTSGTPSQNKMLAEAMGVDTSKPISTWRKQSKQFENFDDFTDMIRRTALVAQKNSTTAMRQQIIKEEAPGFAKQLAKAYAYPLVTYKKVLFDKMTDMQTERGRRLMAEALTHPESSKWIQRIKRMRPGTETAIKTTSEFLSLILGGGFSMDILNSMQQAH